MIPTRNKDSGEMVLTPDWPNSDASEAWTVWFADPDDVNWLIINIAGNQKTKVDIGTRSFSKMNMPEEWPRAELPVTMKMAAAAAAQQGANLDKLIWLEYNCDYKTNEVPDGPLWVLTFREETSEGGSVVYSILVSGISGQVLAAVNERDEKISLPINFKDRQETRSENHQADIIKFFSYFGTSEVFWAVQQLSFNLKPDDAAAQQWLKNFESIDAVEIVKIEQIRLAEWTKEHEYYKVTLQVKTSASPDQYGWDNGLNIRYLSIIPQGAGPWKIDELSGNP